MISPTIQRIDKNTTFENDNLIEGVHINKVKLKSSAQLLYLIYHLKTHSLTQNNNNNNN